MESRELSVIGSRTSSSQRRPWWGRIDPLVYIIGVTALIVYTLHGFDGALSHDLAIYSYAGQQVVEGVPPYVGILNRAGPLAHLIPAIGVAGARAAGFDDLFGMRLLYMLIAVACVCIAYALARDLFTSRLAGVVAAAAFLSFNGFIEYATYGPREKTPMVLFLLSTLLAVTKHRWFAAGISISLATLVWQPVFLVGIAAAITAVTALRPSERGPALLRIAAGGLLPVALCTIYFALAGALAEFVDGFLLINVRYTEADPLMANFTTKWLQVRNGYGVTFWVMMVGLAAVPILTFLEVRRGHWRAPVGVPIVAIAGAIPVALAWSFRDFNSWPDAFVFLPLACVGVGGIAKEVCGRLPPRTAFALALASVVASVAVAVTYSTTQRDVKLKSQRDSVAALLQQLQPDASILSIGAPQTLVLSGKTNPTRYQTFGRGLERYMDDTWPGGLAGFGEWVGRQQAAIVALNSSQVPWYLRKTIKGQYRRLPPAPGWRWFVHRSVKLRPNTNR